MSFIIRNILAAATLLATSATLPGTLVAVSAGSNILLVPIQTRSHILGHLALGELLAARGHRVHMVVASSYSNPQRIEQAGVRVLTFKMPGDVLAFDSEEYEKFLADTVFVSKDKFEEGRRIFGMIYRDCELMMADEGFVSAARELRFDLAIFDAFPLLPCTLILPHNLSIPYGGMTAYINHWKLRMPALPSFRKIQSLWPKLETTPSSFLDRLNGLASHVVESNAELVVPVVGNGTLLEKYSQERVSWDELYRRSTIILWEQSPVLDFPSAIYPNTILVPGLTIAPVKRVEGQLGAILDGAQRGVVLVTFGATSNYMPKEIVEKFLSAFASLEQLTFLVKFVVPAGVPLPPNVVAKGWLPQNDILGHRHTKLFITHCGNNGQYEALYHAVPIIGFPLFAEQPHNCHRALLKGFGLEMDIHDFHVDQLRTNILEVIGNPVYADAVKKASEIWRSERMTSREKAAYWIEHVIKYGGDHLRPQGFDLTLPEFLMIDVLALFVVAFSLAVVLVYACVKYSIGRIRRIVRYPTKSKPKGD